MDRDHTIVEFSVEKVALTNDGRERQKATFYVQNRCSASRKVRVAVSKDSDPVFTVLSGHAEKYLSAGLKLSVVLQYCPKERGVVNRGQLGVFVDDKLTISVPIEALPPSPRLEVSTQSIRFDGVVAEHQIISRTFSITNSGTKAGPFTLSPEDLPEFLTVSPVQGSLGPQETANIQVELLCKETGPFSGAIRISSREGSSTVAVLGTVQARLLQLLEPFGLTHDSPRPLECIAFGPTYYGTVLSQTALLFNKSPVATDYLSVLDGQAEGSEHGVDRSEGLALACTAGGLGQSQWREHGRGPASESLISVSPAQGSLAPYEKRLVEFTFSPRFHRSSQGWSHHQAPPTQRDYVLFVKFITVGAQSALMCSSGQEPLEVAVTGRAVPVDLSILPGPRLDFGSCTVGQCSTQEIQLCNGSNVLPLDFSSRPLAHYKCTPPTGRIAPGHKLTVSVLFQPRQLGKLDLKLLIDVLGRRGSEEGGGAGKPGRNGMVHKTTVELKGSGVPRGVGVQSGGKGGRVSIARPDDLATSIRPHDGKRVVVTPYTRTRRHTYVDPDYAYSDEERGRVRSHKDSYTAYIRARHSERTWRKRESTHSDPTYRNSKDLGMTPAQGLQAPKLTNPKDTKMRKERGKGRGGSSGSGQVRLRGEGPRGKMLTSRALLTATALKLHCVEQCAHKPSSPDIALECKTVLSPEQLSQIHFDPAIVEFGPVVIGSEAEEVVTLKNFLTTHISVKLKVIGEEVRCGFQTSGPAPQLTVILPPQSYLEVPFSLHTKDLGLLERSVEYCINHHHSHHLPVKANVVRLSLTLSTNSLPLSQPPLATPTAGLRGSVLVSNEHSVPAKFQWLARQGVDTNVFYMMHPRGTVPPFGFLECEFVCQPSYSSPDSAQFLLAVEGEGLEEEPPASNLVTLVANFGKPQCSFREKRVLFGTVPLNLLTTKTVRLENTGDCHAHFQVVDPTPFPGMRVFPRNGCVPMGGTTEIKLLLQAESVEKFDVTLRVAIRGGGRPLSLRLAGAVEQPAVTIDKVVILGHV